MSRLCRLKNASHGEDGQWAHDEIVNLRKQRDELLAALNELASAVGLAIDGSTGWDAHKNARKIIARVKARHA